MSWPRSGASALLGALVVACGASQPQVTMPGVGPAGSPLGPSYVLVPLPGEDDGLVGRILPSRPEPGHSLEETARPNPCGEHLAPAQTTPLAATFEDVEELSVGVKARAALGMFGFEGDVARATHFYYRLEATRRIARADTNEYVACCKEKGCGYGYVSALVYGEGEYATGSDERASGGVQVSVAGASGHVRLQVLHRRKVRGWLAALVTVTETGETTKIGPLGAVTALAEESLSQQVKARYEPDRIKIDLVRGNGGERLYVLRDGYGAVTENEFARRYRGLTGAMDLDHVEGRRNTTSVIVSGGLLGASAAVLVWGITSIRTTCSADDELYADGCDHVHVSTGDDPPSGYRPFGNNFYYDPRGTTTSVGGILLTILGGTLTFGTGLYFLGSLFGGADGSPTEHRLSEGEVYPYVKQYNRALVRKTLREVERLEQGSTSSAGPTIEPSLGLGTLGLSGRF